MKIFQWLFCFLIIRFLRWSSYNIYLRHSKRVKQLETRMNQMIHDGINQFQGDNATVEQFLATMPSMFNKSKYFKSNLSFVLETLENLVRSSVFYIQEV